MQTTTQAKANIVYRPMNGVSTCTCGKRVSIMGWRYGEMFKFFCSEEHARIEGERVDSERVKEGFAPVRARKVFT